MRLRRILKIAVAGVWLLAATGVSFAGPTKTCNPAPKMSLIDLYSPATSRVTQITAAVANPASNTALMDFLGNPLTVSYSPSSSPQYLQLRYDPVQDTGEIVARLRADANFARDFSTIGRDGFSSCFDPRPYSPPIVVTEYYNAVLNHYFLSSSDFENNAIDRGDAGAGWARTGQRWVATQLGDCGEPIKAVYRFYGERGVGPNSHFYTASPEECGGLRNGRGWSYEGIVFGAELPVAGSCPASAPVPVYRAYNNRFMFNDSNHRYAIDPAIYQDMIRQGWIGEGLALCVKDRAPTQ